MISCLVRYFLPSGPTEPFDLSPHGKMGVRFELCFAFAKTTTTTTVTTTTTTAATTTSTFLLLLRRRLLRLLRLLLLVLLLLLRLLLLVLLLLPLQLPLPLLLLLLVVYDDVDYCTTATRHVRILIVASTANGLDSRVSDSRKSCSRNSYAILWPAHPPQ